jgi:DivIVA domain-containing protein
MIQPYGDLVEAITNARFTPVRLREGYDMGDVDDLLDRIVAGLGRGEPIGPLIDAARFAPVRLREGYDTDEVDRFLESVRTQAGEQGAGTTRPAGGSAVPAQRGLLQRLRDHL